MLHTFEARLTVDPALDALLASNAAHWSFGLRKAWSLLVRQKLTNAQAYAKLSKLDFTSKQVGSLLIATEMRREALRELKKHELKQLQLAVSKRERAILDKDKKVLTLQKRHTKLLADRAKFAPKGGKERGKRYIDALRKLRDIEAELMFCRNWVKQKERVLWAKRAQLRQLVDEVEDGRLSLCFGSKTLLRQRPTAFNADTSPFANLDDWKLIWDIARNGQWWSVGHTKAPQGNAEVQWYPDSNELRIRLTDKLAHERMDASGVPRTGGKQSDMPKRMACRFITFPNVDFVSHKGAAREALIAAVGKQPVSMRVLCRLQQDGSRAWYVQASLDVGSGFEGVRPVTREAGVLGVDFNARGLAWCAVKPDGNRQASEHGFIPWQMKGQTELERRQIISTAAAELLRTAQRLQLAVAMESLDFSTTRLMMRAGSVNRRYNDMLGSLPSSQFAERLQRNCERSNIILYAVNPLYSSVGGFAKYGRTNRMNADTAAAWWIGRQALYAEVKETKGIQATLKHHDERLVFSHLPDNRTQSTKALAGKTWRDVAWVLGKNRRLWGNRFHKWVLDQVETASCSKELPALALSPPG